MRNGVASGFHAHPGNRDPPSAEAEILVSSNTDPIRCFQKESVLDKPRKAPPNGRFCFFPDLWSKTKIDDVVKSIYKYCKQRDKVDIGRNTICGRNYKDEGFDIIIAFSKVGKSGARINSAYANSPQGLSLQQGLQYQYYTMRLLLS